MLGETSMSKTTDTLNKAYGNIPKEPTANFSFDINPYRGIRYYWLKLVRKIRFRKLT
jgi:hypothetical protein